MTSDEYRDKTNTFLYTLQVRVESSGFTFRLLQDTMVRPTIRLSVMAINNEVYVLQNDGEAPFWWFAGYLEDN